MTLNNIRKVVDSTFDRVPDSVGSGSEITFFRSLLSSRVAPSLPIAKSKSPDTPYLPWSGEGELHNKKRVRPVLLHCSRSP